MQQNLLMGLIGVVAFFVAYRDPAWSGWTYALVGPLMTVHGTIYGRRVRMLAEKKGAG